MNRRKLQALIGWSVEFLVLVFAAAVVWCCCWIVLVVD